MTFSDNDLERLKEMILNSRKKIEEEGVGGTLCVDADSVLSYYDIFEHLITRLESSEAQRDVFKEMYERKAFELSKLAKRLEAAENFINEHRCNHAGEETWGYGCDLFKAWRMAAGK